jgi:uncharacterized repeat protein (TIGR03833 family)
MAKGSRRSEIRPGLTVDVILKADQRTGKKTRGVVRDILTNSANHPHGIKVRLADGQVGRVCDIVTMALSSVPSTVHPHRRGDQKAFGRYLGQGLGSPPWA